MESLHRYLGEALFIIYVIAAAVAFFSYRRGRKIPTPVMAIAHALLTVQVILGIILIATDGLRGVPWYHPVLGLLALLMLAIIPTVLRKQFVRGLDMAIGFSIIAALALAAQLVAQFA